MGRGGDGDDRDMHYHAIIVGGSQALFPLPYVGVGYYLVAAVMSVSFLAPWTLRFFWYSLEVKEDLVTLPRGY